MSAYIDVLTDFFDFALLRLWATFCPKRVVMGVGGGPMGIYVRKIFGELLGLKDFCFVEDKGAWKNGEYIGDVAEIYGGVLYSSELSYILYHIISNHIIL